MSKTLNHRSFFELGLNSNLISVLNDIGYKKPLPIQERCIPYLLNGRDILGMAQTGSGKTAAFVLPLLHNIDVKKTFLQGLIITPTRELTIQIGKVCFDFARHVKEINITTLYGGQNYGIELKALKKKPHLIIGTPGRLIDHLKRGTVNLSYLKTLIIDEADEMLRMGFIEDVKYIVKHVPIKRQTALFSATLPRDIREISKEFMNDPIEVYVHANTNTSSSVIQNYYLVDIMPKHEVLMRFLEVEKFDAAIVFVRTKCATLKISQILEEYGYNSAALNGDMDQNLRHLTLDRLRRGNLDILIATDVAARGLDIHRVSLVINYDIPINSSVYIHRIGRTGRAGNVGKSLLFVENREYRLFCSIKRKINMDMKKIQCPTIKSLVANRLRKFSEKIKYKLNDSDIIMYRSLLLKIKSDIDVSSIENLAAVLLKMAQGRRLLVLPPDPMVKKRLKFNTSSSILKKTKFGCLSTRDNKDVYIKKDSTVIFGLDTYRMSIGRNDGIKIQHIIDFLVRKVNVKPIDIGNVKLFSSHSIIEVSRGIFNKKMLLRLSHLRILKKSVDMRLLKK